MSTHLIIMSSSIQLFTAPTGNQIRTIELNNTAYFVGKDIALALGYNNPQKAIRDHVDTEDKTVNETFTVNGTSPTLINESGLYSLILSSKLSTAKQFKRWVTSEVLPAIHRQGGYMVDIANESPEETMARALTIASATMERQKARIAALESQNAQQQQELTAAAPKVLFADAVSQSDTCILVGELAKLIRQNGYNIGQNRLFAYLREHGYLTKSNSPTQRSMEKGLFRVIERTVVDPQNNARICLTTKVTGKGQQYFCNMFLNKQSDVTRLIP